MRKAVLGVIAAGLVAAGVGGAGFIGPNDGGGDVIAPVVAAAAQNGVEAGRDADGKKE